MSSRVISRCVAISLAAILMGCNAETAQGKKKEALGGRADVAASDGSHSYARTRMVADQIVARGIKDDRVLDAMRTVPRHEFVPISWKDQAHADHPLSIGWDQTISQPYIVAFMTEALRVHAGQKVLEVGTGSGYQAAILTEMGVKVYSVEIVKPLGKAAKKLLERLGYDVSTRIGDGYDGWPQESPFDGIIVTAAPKKVPPPLAAQLKEGGRLVIPLGGGWQDLKVFRKVNGVLVTEDTLPVAFVPMTGKALTPSRPSPARGRGR